MRWRRRLLLLAVGLIVSIVLCEVSLRLFMDDTDFLRGHSSRIQLPHSAYVRDPEFGFRPRLGTEYYDRFGAMVEGTAPSRTPDPDKRRVLFIGDSVTRRGTIVDALRAHFGDTGMQYWNAGVESFETTQEVLYYERFNAGIGPDHVVLTLHHNDFDGSPLAFRDEGDRLSVLFSNRGEVSINEWVYKKCYLYRLWCHVRLRGAVQEAAKKGRERVRRSLRRLRDRLQADGVQFTVLVLPLCKPLDQWSETEQGTHRLALEALQELKILHIDLLAGLEEAVTAGIPLQQDEGDWWHPSADLGRVLVEYMVRRGFSL